MELVVKWIADLANSLFETPILPATLKWMILGGIFIFVELLHRSWMIIWFTIGSLAAAIFAIFMPDAQLIQIGVFFGVTGTTLIAYLIIRPEEAGPIDPIVRGIGRQVKCVRPIGNGSNPVGAVQVDGIEYKARLVNGGSPVKKDEWVTLEDWNPDDLTVTVRPLEKVEIN